MTAHVRARGCRYVERSPAHALERRHTRASLLALGCVVLALALTAAVSGCRKGTEPPVAAGNTMADSADQVLFGVHFRLTEEGLNQALLLADTAYIFEDGTRMEFRDVALEFFTELGAKNATLTAREGTYNTRTQVMQGHGDVVVVSEDGRRLTTEQIRFEQLSQEISSDSAFVLTEPGGRRLEGVGFVSDPDMQNMRCLRSCSGIGGSVAVPVQ
ncbi:MAG: LPS export ABC transporter periplasmic protein LptC [Gemmatimonadaceae bacterium]